MQRSLLEKQNDSLNKKYKDETDPKTAFDYGQSYNLPMSKKGIELWDSIKKDVMIAVLFLKFTQNPLLREMLKATNPFTIVQLKIDPVWGPGFDGNGLNLLGKCLMDVREILLKGQEIDFKKKYEKWEKAYKEKL